jgi:hypothetical protein
MTVAATTTSDVSNQPTKDEGHATHLMKVTLAFVLVLLAVSIFLLVKVINLQHQVSHLSNQVSHLSASTATGAPDPRIDDLCRFVGIWAAKSKVTLTTIFPSTAITGCETQADEAYHSVIAGH